MLSEAEKRQLDEEGHLAFPGLMSAELVDTLRRRIDVLFAEEGDAAGSEFKREPGVRFSIKRQSWFVFRVAVPVGELRISFLQVPRIREKYAAKVHSRP